MWLIVNNLTFVVIFVVSKSSEMICNLITTVSDWQTRRIMMMTTATLGTDTDTDTHTLTV